jgi:hypothetical protein
MHVVDVVLNSFYNLFRSHQCSPAEKLSPVFSSWQASAAAMHNVIKAGGEEVIPT